MAKTITRVTKINIKSMAKNKSMVKLATTVNKSKAKQVNLNKRKTAGAVSTKALNLNVTANNLVV
jgi:hypothetical protein